MSVSISNHDLQAVVGYLDSFIALGGKRQLEAVQLHKKGAATA